MKATELREKSVEELNKELIDLLKEQFNLRAQGDRSAESVSPSRQGEARYRSRENSIERKGRTVT